MKDYVITAIAAIAATYRRLRSDVDDDLAATTITLFLLAAMSSGSLIAGIWAINQLNRKPDTRTPLLHQQPHSKR